ncbi:thiol-disulfide oxidoreductase DCC [Paraglaciecola hydrolytica]|uniref:Thiol-disulfide oxidoreductase DCC n=2 Tax=Paraglaciecola hydrolytica TaxID=1799789 RepID=A0A136A5G1_9ALTE|nr:thiol-disulfide oxidoreductase DCC [Paraglaciecola hydrolytica]
MDKLKELDSKRLLVFVDIQSSLFAECYPQLNWQQLNARIHGQLPDGRMISGLDVTYLAWKLVGKGWVYAPLRWWGIKWFANWCYVFFARHRYRISYLLTGEKRLAESQICSPCEVKRR